MLSECEGDGSRRENEHGTLHGRGLGQLGQLVRDDHALRALLPHGVLGVKDLLHGLEDVLHVQRVHGRPPLDHLLDGHLWRGEGDVIITRMC